MLFVVIFLRAAPAMSCDQNPQRELLLWAGALCVSGKTREKALQTAVNVSAEVAKDLIFTLPSGYVKKILFCSPIYPTLVWKIYMTKGDLCKVKTMRNDCVCLSNAPGCTRSFAFAHMTTLPTIITLLLTMHPPLRTNVQSLPAHVGNS